MHSRWLIFLSLVTTVIVQGLVCGSVSDAIMWLYINRSAFTLTWVALASLSLCLGSIFNSTRWAFALAQVPLLMIALISFLKLQRLGMPLFPWDFQLTAEVIEVVAMMFKATNSQIAALVTFCVLCPLFFLLLPRRRLDLYFKPRQRAACALSSFVLFSVIILANNPVHSYFFSKTFKFNKNKPHLSFIDNGIVINTILVLEKGQLYPPRNYSDEHAKKIYESYNQNANEPVTAVTPDIVVVMSESLFDPLQLRGIRWKKDPLEFTRSLVGTRPLSLAVVPTYGGKTANSEFEFLTGNSLRFLARGAVPYEHLIEAPIPSLPETLKSAGYITEAIHPGTPGYWNRNKIYPLLGFDNFLTEQDFKHATVFGNYISDESILEVLENSLTSSERPHFEFIVTLQNHLPYAPSAFELKDLYFDPVGLASDEHVVLNYYSALLEATDDFHKKLVELLKNRKRPCLLVIFGDHLPSLLPNFGVFTNRMVHTASQVEWDPTEWQKMYTTPLVIWSNFGIKDEKSPIEASLLAARLLRQVGVTSTPYQKFLASLSDTIRVINPNLDLKNSPLIQDYKHLQYGLLTHSIQEKSLGSNQH